MEKYFKRKDESRVENLKKQIGAQVEIIQDSRKKLAVLEKAKEKSEIEYFCGHKIIQEEILYSEFFGIRYSLIIYLVPLMIKASVTNRPGNEEEFRASIERIIFREINPTWYENNYPKDTFKISNFEEAKEIALGYMKTLIDEYEEMELNK